MFSSKLELCPRIKKDALQNTRNKSSWKFHVTTEMSKLFGTTEWPRDHFDFIFNNNIYVKACFKTWTSMVWSCLFLVGLILLVWSSTV